MGLGVSLITFSPNTTIKSADVNTNFTNLNATTTLTGTATQAGNLQLSGGSVGATVTSGGTVTFSSANPKDPNGNIYTAAVKASGNGGSGGVLVSTGWLPASTNPLWLGVEPVGSTTSAFAATGSGTAGSVMIYCAVTVSFSLLSTNPFVHS